jgi:hypothetical protein
MISNDTGIMSTKSCTEKDFVEALIAEELVDEELLVFLDAAT